MNKQILLIMIVILGLALVLFGCSGSGQTNISAGNNVTGTDQGNANASVNANDAGGSGPVITDNTAVNNSSGSKDDASGNTVNTAAANTAENTGNNAENTNAAENTGNNAENTNAAENTGNNAENTSSAGNTGSNTNTDPAEAAVMEEIIGVWYDQYSYGEIRIEKDGSCIYRTYAGDFSGTVSASESSADVDQYAFDLRLEDSLEEYPNLFYDKENDLLYYDTGGQTNLFSHEAHPYEPIDWIYAMWGEELLQYYPDHDEYKIKETDISRVVLFDTIRSIKDLHVLSVSLTNVDKNGDPSFICEVLYTLEELSPGKGFAVWVEFPGDLPANGIMYADPISGEMRKYTISMSGEDGSLILEEFH